MISSSQVVSSFGCIPNSSQPEVLSEIQSMAVPWDGQDITKTPPVVSEESFLAALEKMPEVNTLFWEKFDWEKYFQISQSYRPCCALFGVQAAAMARLLIQIGFQFSEQIPERFQSFITWILSKGGSVRGGQTIAAMAKAAQEYGLFLEKDVGKYDPGNTSTSRSDIANENAKQHQISYCLYTGDEPAKVILDACSKGFSVFVGNDRAIADGVSQDANGVSCVSLSGRWSHATAFAGYKVVNGKRYVRWWNSHGKIYIAPDNSPSIGGWMSEETVTSFMGGSFADVCVLLYVEAPYDETITPTLNVEE